MQHASVLVEAAKGREERARKAAVDRVLSEMDNAFVAAKAKGETTFSIDLHPEESEASVAAAAACKRAAQHGFRCRPTMVAEFTEDGYRAGCVTRLVFLPDEKALHTPIETMQTDTDTTVAAAAPAETPQQRIKTLARRLNLDPFDLEHYGRVNDAVRYAAYLLSQEEFSCCVPADVVFTLAMKLDVLADAVELDGTFETAKFRSELREAAGMAKRLQTLRDSIAAYGDKRERESESAPEP